MTLGSVNATVNKQTQWAVETDPADGTTPTVRLDAVTLEPAIKLNLKKWMSQGRRVPSHVTPGREWTESKITHLPDFNALSYLLSGLLGIVTPAQHSMGTLSYDSIWTGAATGYLNPQTYGIAKGDAKQSGGFGYGLITDLNIHGNSDASDGAGVMLGQKWDSTVTMVDEDSITPCPRAGIAGPMWDTWLDTAHGSIGTTKLTDVLDGDLAIAGMYGPRFTSDSSLNGTYGAHVDKAPTFDLKLAMLTDTAGMSPLAKVRVDDTVYIRRKATGPLIEGAIHYGLTIDLPMKCTAIDPFGNDEDAYKIGWTFSAAEDYDLPPWLVTLTNLISALG